MRNSKYAETLGALDRGSVERALRLLVDALRADDELAEQVEDGDETRDNSIIPAFAELETRTANVSEHRADTTAALNFLALNKADKSDLDDLDDIKAAVNLLDISKSNKADAISTSDATDLATAITLLNEIKTKLNSMSS